MTVIHISTIRIDMLINAINSATEIQIIKVPVELAVSK